MLPKSPLYLESILNLKYHIILFQDIVSITQMGTNGSYGTECQIYSGNVRYIWYIAKNC